MKKYILLMLVILLTTYANSQTEDFICGTLYNPDPNPIGVYSQSTDPVTLADFDPLVFNIYFWGINKDDGSSGNPFTEQDALMLVQSLNIAYNPYKVFFKYYGYNYVNNSSIYIETLNHIKTYFVLNDLLKEDSFNVFIPYQLLHPNGSGDLIAGAASINTTMSAINSFNVTPYTVIHEIGHNLGLLHTFNNYNNDNCEHVTRDPTDVDDPLDPYDTFFNAKTAGDWVVDTAASSKLRGSSVNEDCEYIDDGLDCQGTPYEIIEETKNYMGYIEPDCASVLTMGQGIRVRERIEEDYNSIFTNTETIIASLYEPYKGNYPMYYPHPLPWQYPLFQPGFAYKFISCCCEYEQPSDYGDISFSFDNNTIISEFEPDEVNYQSIIHPNHAAIIIEEVDMAFEYSQIQKCYDNYSSPPIIGGTIITFNDGILNNNVTITPQDSSSINNPQLITNLQPGLYNVIKNFENGDAEETVILKEN
jgi:hypothetical protein